MELSDIKSVTKNDITTYPTDSKCEYVVEKDLSDFLEQKGAKIYYGCKQFLFVKFKSYKLCIEWNEIFGTYRIEYIYHEENKFSVSSRIDGPRVWEYLEDREKFTKRLDEEQKLVLSQLPDCKVEGNLIELGESWRSGKPLHKIYLEDENLRKSLDEYKFCLKRHDEISYSVYKFIPYLLVDCNSNGVTSCNLETFTRLLKNLDEKYREDLDIMMFEKFGMKKKPYLKSREIDGRTQDYRFSFEDLILYETEYINRERFQYCVNTFNSKDELIAHIEKNLKFMEQ